MKVILTKSHGLGKEGDVIDVTEARANYLKRVGAATYSAELSNDEGELPGGNVNVPNPVTEYASNVIVEHSAPVDITTDQPTEDIKEEIPTETNQVETKVLELNLADANPKEVIIEELPGQQENAEPAKEEKIVTPNKRKNGNK